MLKKLIALAIALGLTLAPMSVYTVYAEETETEDAAEETETEDAAEETEDSLPDEELAEKYVSLGLKFLKMPGGESLAAKYFEKADELGNLTGSFLAGFTYDRMFEDLDESHYATAIEYYEKCIDTDMFANICMALLYLKGDGVSYDLDKAIEYADNAAIIMLNSDDEDIPEEMEYVAQLILGLFLYEEKLGYDDAETALEYFMDAAENDFPLAMRYIGKAYSEDRGIEPDYDKAMEWYQKGAALNDFGCANNIGIMYYNGFGVDSDMDAALEWILRAVGMGSVNALNNLAWFYQEGVGVEQDYEMARELYEELSESGNVNAYAYLGWMYENGLGGDADIDLAIETFEKAADKGDVYSMSELGYIYSDETLGVMDQDKADEWFKMAEEAEQ